MTPRKQSKRMWGVFVGGELVAGRPGMIDALEISVLLKLQHGIAPHVVCGEFTWAAPKPNPKRKAKRT